MQGDTILKLGKREGFAIPTLCYHEVLGPSGRCKVCTVEVREAGKSRLVAACLYPAREGMEIITDSEQVRLARKQALETLLSLAPSSDVVRKLASEYGSSVESGTEKSKGKCILCNQCVQTCRKIVGIGALEMRGKGDEKAIGTRSDEPTCIACGACVVICPTGAIEMEEQKGRRSIWGASFQLAVCTKCGRSHAPLRQLEWISARSGVPVEQLSVCQDCK